MAAIKIPDEGRTITDAREVTSYFASRHIEYEKVGVAEGAGADASADAILAAWKPKIDELKAKGGYVTADVIDVKPDTPNLDAMLKKFSSEHWHDEDEVRLIVHGRGLFHIHPPDNAVFAIEVEAGDLIRVPKGTHHWFDLCGDKRIRAIRLFQDMTGWTPHYTGSGVDGKFQPVCFGPAYIPTARVTPGVSV